MKNIEMGWKVIHIKIVPEFLSLEEHHELKEEVETQGNKLKNEAYW